jgi:hypothetical protein
LHSHYIIKYIWIIYTCLDSRFSYIDIYIYNAEAQVAEDS